MRPSNGYPYFLVVIQFASLIIIALTAPIVSSTVLGLFIECAGILVGIHAIYTMKITNMNITPMVKDGAHLVTSGIYKFVRHPMYLGLIMLVIPLIVSYLTWFRGIIFIVLIATLFAKIRYEEDVLIDSFPEYLEYRKKSWRLIPYVY
ncbi:MAG: isoprenylcysteine carboxylmethyltransferase family protein [Bacteroidales bacterium]|jgi:protein-S-isoprenylcysteine O-methyltransferase Ste14|nr:isoprenylcysteine carboxylmethyltransferase family protein [Bacteroidales bacterium]